jgi:hypothetical protein
MMSIFVVNEASSLMVYMLTTLIFGVALITYLNTRLSNMAIRKLFHVLALALFYPGILHNVRSANNLIVTNRRS